MTEEEANALTRRVEALSRRVRLANLLALGALAVALAGGTAWAASRYLITSTKQIKPSVLAKIEGSLKGSNGPASSNGGAGAQGATGPSGRTGPQGATGPQGETGPPGAQGPQGEQGPQGATGLNGLSGAGAGYYASTGYVALATQPNVPVTGVVKQLPPGNYIANGSATVTVYDVNRSEWLITCTMTDTPQAGTPVSDTVTWQAVTDYDVMLQTPDSAESTLPFEEAVDSPNSTSTLSISCEAAGYVPGSSIVYGPASSAMNASSVTAVQTSTNS